MDSIPGTVNSDFIEALGGDDFVLALTGDDEIYGGDGNDTLFAHEGDDTIYGEWLQSSQGEDVVAGIRTPEQIEDMAKFGFGETRVSRTIRQLEILRC